MMSASDLAVRWNLRLLHGRQEWRGTCPACGYANAFALTERDGNVLPWCFSGQDPNALGGLMRGMGRATGRVAPLPQRIDQGRQKARAESLWRRGIPCVGTPAATYLGVRGLPGLATSLALRFCWNTPHPTRCALPTILALVQDVHGEPVGVHRTYLRPDGIGKAAVNPQRATLGQVAGGAIRLHPEA